MSAACGKLEKDELVMLSRVIEKSDPQHYAVNNHLGVSRNVNHHRTKVCARCKMNEILGACNTCDVNQHESEERFVKCTFHARKISEDST